MQMKTRVKDIAEVQIGYQARGRLEDIPDGTHCVIQMRDIDDAGRLNTARLARVIPERGSERYAVSPGDVVFRARGSRNLAFVLRDVPPSTLASNHFYIVRMRQDSVLPGYLAWFVNQPPAQAHFCGRTQGTTMMLVPKAAFEGLEVDVPPLAVQRAIVELAALREKERGLFENLEGKRDTLIRALCLNAARRDE
jgi:hypothetical protein